MTIRIALNHKTSYDFDRSVQVYPHVVRLRPAPHTRTPVHAYSLRVTPAEHFVNWQQDPFGNYLARLVFPKKVRRLVIEVDLVAEMTVINPFEFFVEPYAEHYPFGYQSDLRTELAPYLEVKESGPRLSKWLATVDRSKREINDFLVDLNQHLQSDISYTIRMEPGVQSCEETLERAIGSCRDSAWLLVQILRHLGLAARFVSGYLVQLTADQASLDGPSGPAEDFTDLHAWAEVYVPGAGWLGLDPTSGLFAGEGHIPLACTPNPTSAAPITGATGECEVSFQFSNSVSRIHETPRVTKPYRDEQWGEVLALGQRVDDKLAEHDVRLTMGGEPTFVSIDDMDGDEWTTAALGERKLEMAGDLLRRLWRRFAPGGVLHYGQGKWYPGEPLPRWSLGCFWRRDGVPVWRDPALLADDGSDHGIDLQQSLQFARRVARALGVEAEDVTPGYEDPLYHLWQEGNLPANLDPLANDLEDADERSRLTRLLQRGLGKPAGFALPLGWNEHHKTWASCRWSFRRGYMFLSPGDSPMGLRLPLDALPWVAEREEPQPRSLFEPAAALGDHHGDIARRLAEGGEAESGMPEPAPAEEVAPAKIPHTALCLEPRDGCLYVFLPPVTEVEHYLHLIAAIELVAAELAIPVRIEGYGPPADTRLEKILVTPDPGVIEVNVHPVGSWGELVENTTALYEEARYARLGTEKFMLDGRHTGTGGGNHVTIGGATPADSPMLRRPELLRSLLTYWQHHPGLSYLFSGMFIGPTSQAPRVDEARAENLYELEVAFEQLPAGDVDSPWLVDRLLRNLLVDVTGNTHRTEFCIDKLYSPNGANGRLGLVELRAFEMPPHARMSLVQMLLVRTLVARFWSRPYRKKLVRWGTELHDRFMLPHYVWTDMADVVADLQGAGFGFELDWLEPFHEFRFPHYGRVRLRDIEIELRFAIEPWHVLGEEVTSLGTARFVDSSVERLQVKITGLTDSRYVLACNGRRVPLRNTGTHGEFVAGVRYRAWQPPSALHPTIGVHAPLVFDLVDTWNDRAVGGCSYHVQHPGGRNPEVFPVNANEAESRRTSRFWSHGHTPGVIRPVPDRGRLGQFYAQGNPPGPMTPPPATANSEYPYTLDMRLG